MKVNVIGFEMSFAKSIGIPELYQLLESSQGKEINQGSIKYVYFTDLIDGFIVGLVLRFKKDKMSIATTINADGELMIDIADLGKLKESTEVSIFAINPDTLRGVYYSYVGCLSSSILKTIMKQPHETLKSGNIKSLTQQYSQFGKKDNSMAHKRAVEECKGFFDLTLLSTPSDVNSLLEQYDSISEMEFNSTEALDKAGKYQPDSQFIRKGKVNVTFDNVIPNYQKISKYIKSLISDKKEKDIIKLRGKLASGEEKWLKLGENIEDFGRLDFDNYVDLLPQEKWADYTDCEALQKLIYILNNKTAIFGIPSTDETWRLASATTENMKNKNKEELTE